MKILEFHSCVGNIVSTCEASLNKWHGVVECEVLLATCMLFVYIDCKCLILSFYSREKGKESAQ